jgi:hypothetical protein
MVGVGSTHETKYGYKPSVLKSERNKKKEKGRVSKKEEKSV